MAIKITKKIIISVDIKIVKKRSYFAYLIENCSEEIG